MSYEQWMQAAIHEAKRAEAHQEVPVGAVLVWQNEIIASGFNQPISTCDPSAHAEMVAMRAAASIMKNYRLNEATLVVTLEPCAMCAGAMIQARIKEVVFGVSDPRGGAAGSVFQVLQNHTLNHRVNIVGGVLETECKTLLQNFFKEKRKK